MLSKPTESSLLSLHQPSPLNYIKTKLNSLNNLTTLEFKNYIAALNIRISDMKCCRGSLPLDLSARTFLGMSLEHIVNLCIDLLTV